jgi:hypothetical protein
MSVRCTLNCPTKFPSVSLSGPRTHKQELGWPKLPLEVAPKVDVVWSQDACRFLPLAHTEFFWCTTYHVRIAAETLSRYSWWKCRSEECGAEFYKPVQQQILLVTITVQYNLHSSSTCKHGPGMLLSYSCWRKPTRILCSSCTWLYTRGLRAEGAQYIALLLISRGTNSSSHLELIPTHTINRRWDNVAQCSWVRNTLIPCEACADSPLGKGLSNCSASVPYVSFNSWNVILKSFVLK